MNSQRAIKNNSSTYVKMKKDKDGCKSMVY